ncbi:MAG: quinolinate synthase NadA [Paludibacteraceae bacterium]|nr:quinolinate synthase NadA [Paludibacteraceae bacterium]
MNNLSDQIRTLCKQKNAIIMAHYYQRPEIQDVADFVGDSLALAQVAAKTDADIIVMCGVHFMAETAKILCPYKKVLIPEPAAGCSLADSCKAEDLAVWKAEHPDHLVVSYVNTSAAVKALTDVVVTSSNALKIVKQLPEDKPILFGPDQNLGGYINSMTGRKMDLWNGGCHVHARFSVEAILSLKQQYPDTKVLAHPECKAVVLLLADVIGSTQALLNYAKEHPEQKRFIVATESGILHEMQKACPDVAFIPVPPEFTESVGEGAMQPIANQCGCNECEYMRMNTLQKLYDCLLNESNEIVVDESVAKDAIRPIQRMLEMS